MAASKIMIIRHAEKPSSDGSIAGVNASGATDEEELTVRGWQRSGALVRFFAPRDGTRAFGPISAPDAIFASGVGKHSKSLRPQHTVQALADILKIGLKLNHIKGEEEALLAEVLASNGTALIAWQHEDIPALANRILGDSRTCPQQWPGDRFDLVWLFNKDDAGWKFTQAPQLLLPGDKEDLIPA